VITLNDLGEGFSTWVRVPLRVREQFAGGMPNFKSTQNEFILAVKPGGLDIRDQSRSRYSRSRSRFLDLSRSIFKPVENVLTVETRLFICLGQNFYN
jgi:hypothetical protein